MCRKQDLTDILSTPALLSALTYSPNTAHLSLEASQAALRTGLAENAALAQHLGSAAEQLDAQRTATQTQLLSARALERSWAVKQRDMDAALAPFAPANLYQRLAAGVTEQEAVCTALEESFLDFDGGGGTHGGEASEREVAEWVRRYREAKKVYYLRHERKQRWDEGRVGGWR